LRRWSFNRSLRPPDLARFDAVLGIDGDAADASRAASLPYVACLKGIYADVLPNERGLTRRLLALQAHWERHAAQQARFVVVPSRYAAEAAAHHYRLPVGKLRVVPEPFDVRAWQRALPKIGRSSATVLCVGHLYPRKRVKDLLRAWEILQQRQPSAKLHVVGHGPELEAVRRRAVAIDSIQVEGHVTLERLRHAYAEAAALCMPSEQENFGVATVEAMASGLPVVVGHAGALPETTEGAVRWLTPIGDIDGIASALEQALQESSRNKAARVNPGVAMRYHPSLVAELLTRVLAEAVA
jgi:glycosyltransferase involved in cell wall biosynthesis